MAPSNVSAARTETWFPSLHIPPAAPLFRLTTTVVERLVDVGCANLKRSVDRNVSGLRALTRVRTISGLIEQQQSYVAGLWQDQREALKAVSRVLEQSYDEARGLLTDAGSSVNPAARDADRRSAAAKAPTAKGSASKKQSATKKKEAATLRAVPPASPSTAEPAAEPVSEPRAAPEAVFQIYRDKAGEYRFRLKSADGSVLLKSEGYKTRTSAANGVASVQKNATNDDRYETRTSPSGKPTFTLKAGNNRVIGSSPTFSSTDQMEAAMSIVREQAASSRVEDQTEAA